MLTHLSIHHLAVVEHLELSFQSGMSVLTGETGAGKSILIDALGLTLGERADSGIVRLGSPQADITAIYDLKDLPTIITWLKEQALDSEEECIIRRIITSDGRSRAFINGRTVPLNQVRELGIRLVDIHGQHQHQSLLRSEHQRILLDEYANHPELRHKVRQDYGQLQNLRKEYKELMGLQGQNDKLTLLQYQIQEIDELHLQENEFKILEIENKELAHAELWLSTCATALATLKNDTTLDPISALHQAITAVATLKSHTPKLNICHELLTNALIQLEEGVAELEKFRETLELDPERLIEVDARLSQINNLARKHRIQPEEILSHREILAIETEKLLHLQTSLETLNARLKAAENAYKTSASALSQSRQKTAIQLEKLITQSIRNLEMPNGHFKIEFIKKDEGMISIQGSDEIEFLVSTNPGLALQPLRKVASGGEMSRISLAIQVITAQKMTTPTLIFDEVDAGISGKTAETVGKLLRKLGANTQVLCVTHLPQIAALGHRHFKVEKKQSKENTSTHIVALAEKDRIEELARMLGGALITKHALAHAKEMLETV